MINISNLMTTLQRLRPSQGGIGRYARGGPIDPSDFMFQPATLNVSAPPQQQEKSDDGMGNMSNMIGIMQAIKGGIGTNGGRTIGTPDQKWDMMDSLSSGARADKMYAARGGLGPYRYADGGSVVAPVPSQILREDASYVPMTKGIKAYAIDPQAVAAMGRQVQTPLDIQRAKTPVVAKPTVSANYMVGKNGMLVNTADKNSMLNYLNSFSVGGRPSLPANRETARNILLYNGGKLDFSQAGLTPFSYAGGGMIEDRMGYAVGGATEYDDMLAALGGDSSIIPGITSPASNPGIQSASLSAPQEAGQIDMKAISNLLAQNGGMENMNDLVSLNDSAPDAPQESQSSPSFLPQAEEAQPAYANRLDEVLDTPWRSGLLSAGATMLSGGDIGKGIAAGIAGYSGLKKTKADAKKAASDLAAKAEQQKFDNDISRERLDIMRIGVNNRGSGSGRAPIDVSSKDMDSIEEAALMMVPGVMQIDEKGRKSPSEEALGLIGDKRLSARDVASQVYQQTRNADQAATAYLQVLGIDPSSQEFSPATEASGNWNPFKENVSAQDAGFKPSAKKALADAKEALKNGAPRDKVVQRLKDNGISTEGL